MSAQKTEHTPRDTSKSKENCFETLVAYPYIQLCPFVHRKTLSLYESRRSLCEFPSCPDVQMLIGAIQSDASDKTKNKFSTAAVSTHPHPEKNGSIKIHTRHVAVKASCKRVLLSQPCLCFYHIHQKRGFMCLNVT